MADPVHISKIRIEQKQRPLRLAYVEGVREPIPMGLHDEIRHLYNVPFDASFPSTLDYIAAGVGG